MGMGAWIILVAGIALASYMYFMTNASQRDRQLYRSRFKARWSVTQAKMRQSFRNDDLTLQLRRAGLRLTSAQYQFVRLGICVLAFVYGIERVFLAHSIILLFLPIILWFILIPKTPWPMSMGLNLLEKAHQIQINKQLYRMYVLTKRQLYNFEEKPKTVYHILYDIHPYVPSLQYAINATLNRWAQNPILALDTLAASIGTKSAIDLCRILRFVHESDIASARHYSDNRFKSFTEDRFKGWKWGLKLRHALLFGVLMVTMTFVVLDIVNSYQMVEAHMLSFE